MKTQVEFLQKFFNKKDFCILTMYDRLNKELINNYFELDAESLSLFLEYSKTRDKKIFDTLWGYHSIQKDIFVFCEELYRHFSSDKITTKESFFKELNHKLENSMIKSVFPFYYKDLYNYYLILHENQLEKNYHSYKDNNFGIYYFKNVSSIELREIYNNQDIAFYIILEGLIKYKNKILGNREVIFSNLPSIEREFKMVTSSCTAILFVLKKNFLEQTGLDFKSNTFGTFKLYTLKIFENILNWENVTSENYIKIFQIALYLNERITHNKISVLNLKYLPYKKNIIKIVRKNIFLSEKDITEKLLLSLDVSISKLYKIFSNLFFTTPSKYIESIKILKAYYLLANTNEKIESICEQVGYSPKAFKEKFSSRTGYTPTAFRNMTKEREK